MSLNHKIDFAVIFTVTNANPNGDPLDGNRPRTTLEGLGEISDVCLKRKIRNKLMDMGQNIFVQSDDRRVDDYKTLKERATPILKQKGTSAELAQKACQEWYDVRAFGQVFALKDKDAAKGTPSLINELRPLVGARFQELFHSSVRSAFHLSLTVLVRYRSLGSI